MQAHRGAKLETFLCKEKANSRINRRAATRGTGSTVLNGPQGVKARGFTGGESDEVIVLLEERRPDAKSRTEVIRHF